ncbi:MAG: outer membrane beta-barrel domain-containing protein [Pseudobdellovibrio sp.]
MRKYIIILMLLATSQGFAAVDVPEDELAQESVYPVFDHPQSVMNRNVQTTKRFDVGLFGGFALTEPIYDTSKFGLAANYHFNEMHSLGLLFSQNSTGLSKDAKGLKEQNLDFDRAPKPQNSILLDYNYKPFYGKLSFSKLGVINTTIYGTAAVGMVKYEHKTYPAVALGIGERFYFTSALSLKLDLRLYVHQAPIPFKKGGLRYGYNGGANDPKPSLDSFEERITYTNNLEIGLNYLF